VDKAALKAKVIGALEDDLEALRSAAAAAHAGATHADSKSEGKYDTRAIEASYLAGAQARRVAELEADCRRLHSMDVRAFADDDAIDVGAVVKLEGDGKTSVYLLAPCAGGMRVELNGTTVVLITPQSPMGRLIAGRFAGDDFVLGKGPGRREYEIVDVY
jgi:transcription elongation GreA/GreB family factor